VRRSESLGHLGSERSPQQEAMDVFRARKNI
jgi:hypothetical protein